MKDVVERRLLVSLLGKLRSANGWLTLFVASIASDHFVDAMRDGGIWNWGWFGAFVLIALYWFREWVNSMRAIDLLARGGDST